jgi:hypothetical protein
MKMIYSGLFLAAVSLGGNPCNAQQALTGPSDMDGLISTSLPGLPSVPKQRVLRRAKTEKAEQRPAPNSKLTNWEEEAGRQQADDDRLRRKLNICRNCAAPN